MCQLNYHLITLNTEGCRTSLAGNVSGWILQSGSSRASSVLQMFAPLSTRVQKPRSFRPRIHSRTGSSTHFAMKQTGPHMDDTLQGRVIGVQDLIVADSNQVRRAEAESLELIPDSLAPS